jgi:lysophospholipase L1-like esterase
MISRIGAALAAVLLVLTACAAPGAQRAMVRLPATDPAPPLRILAVGDSITAAGQWQIELGRLLTEAGVPHVITTEALGGSRCDHWPSLLPGILAADQPNLMILYCGTNDDPAEKLYGESATAWSFRYMVETAHAAGAQVLPALVGYSDGTQAPDWLWVANEPATNDTLWSQMTRYLPPNSSGWFPGIANLQLMPGTAEYIGGDTCNPATATCGVHPNDKGYKTVGRLFYDAAAPGMGWPSATSMGEPPLCGMAGHRKGYPRPSYVPCS